MLAVIFIHQVQHESGFLVDPALDEEYMRDPVSGVIVSRVESLYCGHLGHLVKCVLYREVSPFQGENSSVFGARQSVLNTEGSLFQGYL